MRLNFGLKTKASSLEDYMDTLTQFEQFLPIPFTSGEDSSEIIASVCIWAIIIVGVFFFLFQLKKFFSARSRLIRGAQILDSIASDQLASSRRSIDRRMDAIPILGDLWHEFDETLVASRDGDRLFNTLDADHFFNPRTLGKGVTESRSIAAVPGMLTALGVFGTFVGLQWGLSSLDLSDLTTMTESIPLLISGAAIAFKTSVWGILASLGFNITEKFIEGRLTERIRTFQLKTDRLFDRSPGEQALFGIESHVAESEKLLRVLGEQVGDKVQEGISSAIAPALDALAKTVEDLADRQAAGAEDALRGLIEQFSEQLGEAGKQQSEEMGRSAEALTGALGELNDTISHFLDKVGDQIDQLKSITESGRDVSIEVNRQASEFLESASKSQESFELVSDKVAAAAGALGEAVSNLSNVEEQFDATVAKFGRTQEEAVDALKSSASALSGTSGSLSDLGEQLSQVSEVLASSATNFTSSAEEVADSLSEIPDKHREMLEGFFAEFKEGMAQFSESLTEQMNSLSEIPDKHREMVKEVFDQFKEGMLQFSEGLTEQMEEFAKMLQGSTESRVEEWTSNTQQFCNNMTDAVGFLSETITELDERFNSENR
jgi:ABC-type transporter Mla subunit MlaD